MQFLGQDVARSKNSENLTVEAVCLYVPCLKNTALYPKTLRPIEAQNRRVVFSPFSSFIGCRGYAAGDREAAGFPNHFFQCFNKKENLLNQITFPNGSPFTSD